jgi:hypothetical protein
MDTVRDYIVVVPSVLTVIVTFILVLVANFFKDRTACQSRLGDHGWHFECGARVGDHQPRLRRS